MLCELRKPNDEPVLVNPIQVVRLAPTPKGQGTIVLTSDGGKVAVIGTPEQVEKALDAALCDVGDALVGGLAKLLEEVPGILDGQTELLNAMADTLQAAAPAPRSRRPRPRRRPAPQPEPEEEEEAEYAEPVDPVPITPGRGSRRRRVRSSRQRSMRASGTVPEGVEVAEFEDDPDPDELPPAGICVVPGCGEKAEAGRPFCKDCKPRHARRLTYSEHTGRIQEGERLGRIAQADDAFDARHVRTQRDAGTRLGQALGAMGYTKGDLYRR